MFGAGTARGTIAPADADERGLDSKGRGARTTVPGQLVLALRQSPNRARRPIRVRDVRSAPGQVPTAACE